MTAWLPPLPLLGEGGWGGEGQVCGVSFSAKKGAYTQMMPIILLTLQAVVVIVGTLLFSWSVQRRLETRWRTWGWGALAFVGSQVARIPLLIAFNALFGQTEKVAQQVWPSPP